MLELFRESQFLIMVEVHSHPILSSRIRCGNELDGWPCRSNRARRGDLQGYLHMTYYDGFFSLTGEILKNFSKEASSSLRSPAGEV